MLKKNLKQDSRSLEKSRIVLYFSLSWITELQGICQELQTVFTAHANSEELLAVVLCREGFGGPARPSRKECSHLFISNSARGEEMRQYTAIYLFIPDLWFTLLMSPIKNWRLQVLVIYLSF